MLDRFAQTSDRPAVCGESALIFHRNRFSYPQPPIRCRRDLPDCLTVDHVLRPRSPGEDGLGEREYAGRRKNKLNIITVLFAIFLLAAAASLTTPSPRPSSVFLLVLDPLRSWFKRRIISTIALPPNTPVRVHHLRCTARTSDELKQIELQKFADQRHLFKATWWTRREIVIV